MAGFVVRSGSEEVSRWCFWPRFLDILILLLLVLAHSTSAGVLGRERTADTDTRLMGYFETISSDDISNHFKHMLLNISYTDIFGRARPNDSHTRDRGNKNDFNNNNYYNHGNYGNVRHGSTSTGVADRGRVDDSHALLQNDINSLYDEQTLRDLYNDQTLKTLYDDQSLRTLYDDQSLKTLFDDPPVKNLNSFPNVRPTYIRKTIVIPLGLIMTLLSACFCGCLRGCVSQEDEVRERSLVLMTLVAEDDPEAKGQDTDAPPTYTDFLKAESPPSYSEVFTEAT